MYDLLIKYRFESDPPFLSSSHSVIFLTSFPPVLSIPVSLFHVSSLPTWLCLCHSAEIFGSLLQKSKIVFSLPHAQKILFLEISMLAGHLSSHTHTHSFHAHGEEFAGEAISGPDDLTQLVIDPAGIPDPPRDKAHTRHLSLNSHSESYGLWLIPLSPLCWHPPLYPRISGTSPLSDGYRLASQTTSHGAQYLWYLASI